MNLKRICVFCGSNPGEGDRYRSAAFEMGVFLAEQGIEVVFGGGAVGLMGEVANGVLARRGTIIGVIPHALVARELAHPKVEQMRVVDSMHERKALMAELSDGFIALPGGYGTFEEFFEVLTWAQLGLHRKPCGVLNLEGYYSALIGFLDHAVREGFIRQAHREMLLVGTAPAELLARMRAYEPPAVEKWISKEET